MRRLAYQFTRPTALAVAMAFLALIILANATPSPAALHKPGTAAAGTTSKTDRVEVRIKELRTVLKITPDQEELWNNVTDVMRDNAKATDALITARAENAKAMTAVDDFKSYGEITQAQADGTQKFIPVFEALYESMSDAQKKNADKFFSHHGHRSHMKPKAQGK
jgi:hypothetical protein